MDDIKSEFRLWQNQAVNIQKPLNSIQNVFSELKNSLYGSILQIINLIQLIPTLDLSKYG